MKLRKRDWVAVPGMALIIVAAGLTMINYVASTVLWYLGWSLFGVWLVLDIRARRKGQADAERAAHERLHEVMVQAGQCPTCGSVIR